MLLTEDRKNKKNEKQGDKIGFLSVRGTIERHNSKYIDHMIKKKESKIKKEKIF